MRITYNAPRYATFAALKPGEMFREPEHKGLYLKIIPIAHTGCAGDIANSVCIDPHANNCNVLRPGECSVFSNDDIVIPVRSLVVDFEELK